MIVSDIIVDVYLFITAPFPGDQILTGTIGSELSRKVPRQARTMGSQSSSTSSLSIMDTMTRAAKD